MNGPCSRIREPGQLLRRLLGAALAGVFALAGVAALQAQEPRIDGPHTIEAYVSQDALQVLYTRDASVPVLGDSKLRGGFFFNEGRNVIAIAEILTEFGSTGQDPGSRWRARIGPRAYGALVADDNDAFSIGLGGELRYFLTFDRATSVAVSAYYAPDIVTFGQSDGVRDISLDIRTRLNDQTDVFLGWRTLELDLPNDLEVDDGLHLGVQARF